MREFISKCVAGGLSAGVVLLWWPVLFAETDTVTSWFVRGVAWTVCLELVLVALRPFERALWETAHGERITRRMGVAGSRLHAGSPRRRIGRLSAVATAAVTLPAALIVMGLHEQAPASEEPVKVVRVMKVVRPVTVKKVVAGAPAATPSSYEAPASEPVTEVAAPAPVDGKDAERARTVVPRGAPAEEQVEPPASPPASSEGTVSPAPPAPASGSSL